MKSDLQTAITHTKLNRVLFFIFLFLLPHTTWAEQDSLLVDIQLKSVQEHIDASVALLDSDLKKALIESQLALSLSISEKPEVQINAFIQAGSVCFYIGFFDKAGEFWLKALNIAEANNLTYDANRARFNLASLYISLHDFDKAYEKVVPVLNYFNDPKNKDVVKPSQLHALYNNLAVIYSHIKPDGAQAQFNLAITYATANNLKAELVTSQNALLTHFIEFKQWAKADSVARILRAEVPKGGYNYCALLHKRGSIALAKGDEATFLALMNEGETLSKEIGAYKLLHRFAEDLGDYYDSKGNATKALYYKNMRDDVHTQTDENVAHQVLTKSEYEEIIRAVNDAAVQKKTTLNDWGRNILLAVIAIVAFAGLLIGIASAVRKPNNGEVIALATAEQANTPVQTEEEPQPEETKPQPLNSQQELLNLREKLLKDTIAAINTATKKGDSQGALTHSGLVALQNFDLRIQEIDNSFFDALQHKFPDLTPNERRLCMFLKMDMSTKDIIAFTGQSMRAVEIARTRLRKKLGIDNSSTNINSFLRSL